MPSRVLLPRDSTIFAGFICVIPFQCCFRWLDLVVGLLFGHLCAQYINVPLLYGMHSTQVCIRSICYVCMCICFYTGFGYCFLLAVYCTSVQPILIAYFYRCVQCTRYYCQCIILLFVEMGFLRLLFLSHLSQFAKALSRSDNSLIFIFFLLFTYRNYLAVTLIWHLLRVNM